VALTRSKQQLIVVSNEDFLRRGEGRSTMVGGLISSLLPSQQTISYAQVLNGHGVVGT
jgi:hypothetical protein